MRLPSVDTAASLSLCEITVEEMGGGHLCLNSINGLGTNTAE